METLLQDLRYGFRMLLKYPGFTIVAVLTLALGIGMNTAVFSVVNAVLLRPLPYRNPERLVMVWENVEKLGLARSEVAPANFIDLCEQGRAFEQIAAFHNLSLNLAGVGEPERIEGQRVSSGLLRLLGVEPALGRVFLPEEDQPGADAVVVISYGLWQRRFGGSPDTVGKSYLLDNRSTTVIGVMPESFQFPDRKAELWVPMVFETGEASSRGDHYLKVVARLKDETSIEQAQKELDAIAARLAEQHPRTNSDRGVVLVPLHKDMVGERLTPLLIVFGVVGLVLLITCVNIANLLLARAATRQKEFAVRAALGAGQLRLVRQLLTESLLLAVSGGAAGLLVAVWSIGFLTRLIPDSLSPALGLSLDARVFTFTLGVSLLAGVIFGLAPSLEFSRPELSEALKEGSRASAGASRNRLRNLLVVSEVALALVLLIGAGLMIRSFFKLVNVDPGFEAENVLTMRVQLAFNKYSSPEQRNAFYDQMLQRIEALPGVHSAGVISFLPLDPVGIHFTFSIKGRTLPGELNLPYAAYRVGSPDYFRAMEISLLRGRTFTSQDTKDAPSVVIINKNMADRFWPGEDVIGKQIKIGPPDSPNPWSTVIGVVKDVKHNKLEDELSPQIYAPYYQDRRGFVAPRDLVVRTTADPLALAGVIRNEVWAIDQDQPVSKIQTMEEVVSASVVNPRFHTMLLGIFGGLALVLAAVGLYGVMAYSVAQRTHEIGVRMALGARVSDVVMMVLKQGIMLTSIGIALGLGAAFVLTRLMTGLLYGVSSTDLVTFVGVVVFLVVIALLACYIPARRAARVEPVLALRDQ
ncbi:MAG TPA: ABC transporter permease [Blastocatellia bacterium]|nr:ABC transporter permease [Blastocatellia bacterium]